MTDLVFNELSVSPLCETKTDCFHRLKEFIETYKAAEEFDFNRIRFDEAFDQIVLSAGYTLNDFCNENRTWGILLRGLARYPFIDDDSDEEERFIENTFFIKENGEKLKTYGLAAAYLYSTIGIGFAADRYWAKLTHTLVIEGKEKRLTTVLCASKPVHFEAEEFQQWLAENTEIELTESAESKKISLRKDHGSDTLLKFAKKLLKSPYVISVINSLPFNPGERNFIKKIYPTGNIEIVLTDTDMGLGMVIRTTGRNLRETRRIAKIISSQYE
ncbi:hypothetical protein QUF72_05705 [Desulfobacterales bacterium HSG2]|nr:hypothetical protein [Desulfobacterales bacterium HSG2]